MGFFKDFKRDFAQAVNELMPDKDELANEYDDEDMVNTFDEEDNMDIAPEDMLEDLDDFSIDRTNSFGAVNADKANETEKPEAFYEDEEEDEEDDGFGNIPNAEIITEQLDLDIDNLDENEGIAQEMVTELLSVEPEEKEIANISDDELEGLDELDDEDMLENIPDANDIEPEIQEVQEEQEEVSIDEELINANIDAAVAAAMMKHEEDNMAVDEIKTEKVEEIVKDKGQDVDSILTDDTTYITKGTTVTGDITTDGGIDVIGTVQGNINCGGKLIVGGLVKGNVNAGEVYANAAKIEGEIIAEGSVKIGVGSVIVGNVMGTSAVVAGAVNGDIDVQGPVIVDSTAVIMGNIKSRSVQINNGAVIEGFCSQCYSEIDVKSFFE